MGHADFLARFTVDEAGCWVWRGFSRGTYGGFSINGNLMYAHRYSYQHYIGSIPEGLELDHLCRNTGCVNPEHLEPVTHRENVLRGSSSPAVHARQTHCHRGHPFDERNTYRHLGKRDCRACHRMRQAARRAARV